MAKFFNIVRGTRALKPIEFTIWGETARCSMRALNGMEEGDALAAGRAYAVSKGLAEPKETDRLYEIGVMAATLSVACVDSDAPETRYFTGLTEILEHLDTDRIAYLFEVQQHWQDECSPRISKMGSAEWIDMVVKCAEDGSNANAFFRMRRPMQLSFIASLASLYLNALTHKSDTGTNSPSSTSATTPPSESA